MQRTKILGIDYGDRRVGLAMAEVGSMAAPFKILENSADLLPAIQDIIKAENIDLVVVGLPHSLGGQTNERSTVTEKFINNLKNYLNIPVKTVDEQYTSKLYERQGVVRDIDKHAATAILETYLAREHHE